MATPDVLEAEYELYCFEYEAVDASDTAQRVNACVQMRGRVAALQLAAERRAQLLGRRASPNARLEIRRDRIICLHRRLLWEEALEVEQNQDVRDRAGQWIAVVRAYRALNDQYNALGAAANAVESGIEVLRRAKLRPLDLAARLAKHIRLLRRLAVVIARRLPATDNSLGAMKTLAKASVATRNAAAACTAVFLGAGIGAQLLNGADPFRRGFLLRDADDWICLALAADLMTVRAPGAFLDFVQPVFRPLAGSPSPQVAADVVVRAFLSRQLSVLGAQLLGGSWRWRVGARSHEMAKALDEAFARGNDEIAISRGEATSSQTLPWLDILTRLEGQLKLRYLDGVARKGGCANPRRVLVETDGSGVHVPWLALLAQGQMPLDSVLQARLGAGPLNHAAPARAAARVVSGFKVTDDLAPLMTKIAGALASPLHTSASTTDFAQDASGPTPLLVLGCHGTRTAARGDVRLEVNGTAVSAETLFASVSLAHAPVVFAFTCFAGDGFARANGEWTSLPALLLARGARAVVSSSTPAWDPEPHQAALFQLLREVESAARNGDVWLVGRAVTTWVQGMRTRRADPRFWIGWSVWV